MKNISYKQFLKEIKMKIGLISTDLYIYSHGLRAISSYLKKNGHETKFISMPLPIIRNEDTYKIIDYKKEYPKKSLEELHEILKDCDMVGISGMAITFKRTLQLINSLKHLNIPIVWGGIFPTTFPQACIDYCNIICVGEGEEPLLELANKLEKNENINNIKNLWIKKENGEIIKNQIRHKFENLNEIPAPDYDLETNYILEKNGNFSKLNESHIGKWIFYHGIRGCIYTCRFCCNNSLDKIYEGKGAKIRKKSIQLVIKELQDLIKKFPKVERIWFTDDDVNMRTVEELQEFRRLYKENIGLPFQCYMSPTTVTETKLKLLIETGLKQIEFGVQTGSDRVNREIYGRPIFKKAVLRAAEIVNKYKKFIDSVNFQFITTNPYESKEDILETINLIRKFPSPFMIQAYGLVFFPGSPMYYKAISDGYIEKFDDSGYDVDFLNYQKHVKLKNKNTYLNSMIHMMGTNSTSFRNGLIPRFAFKYLLKDEVIEFFENKPKLIKFINSAVEKIRGSYIAEIVHYPNKIKGLVYSIVPKKVKEPIKKALKLDIYSKDYIPVTIEFEATETDKEQNLQSSQPTLKILNNPN